MKVVEIADPSPAGRFAGYRAAVPVNGNPAVAAGPGKGQVDFIARPFRLTLAAQPDFLFDPRGDI